MFKCPYQDCRYTSHAMEDVDEHVVTCRQEKADQQAYEDQYMVDEYLDSMVDGPDGPEDDYDYDPGPEPSDDILSTWGYAWI